MFQFVRTFGVLLAFVGVLGCEKTDDSKAPSVPNPSFEPVKDGTLVEPPERPDTLPKSWKQFESEFGWRVMMPSKVEPKFEKLTFDEKAFRLEIVSADTADARYTAYALTHNPGVWSSANTDGLDYNQKWLAAEVGGVFEASEKRDFEGNPSVDVRFTAPFKDNPEAVVFTRIVQIQDTFYLAVVQTLRDGKAPVSPFIKSLAIDRPKSGDWLKLSPPQCGCSFALPEQPSVSKVDFLLPDGSALPATQYLQSTPGSGVGFTLTVAQVGDAKLMNFAQRDVLDSAAKQVAKRVDGTVAKTVNIKHKGVPGIEAAIKPKGPGVIRSQYFVTNQRVYMLEISAIDPAAVSSTKATQFLKTFEFEKPK